MSTLTAQNKWVTQPGQDFLQLVLANGSLESFIDSNGVYQGNIAPSVVSFNPTAQPVNPVNGQLWYDSTQNNFVGVVNGVVQAIGSGSSSLTSIGKNVVTAQQLLAPVAQGGYGAKFNVQTVPDATLTNGSNIVTCPNADCHFLTTAKVGQIVFATFGGGTSCLDNPDSLLQTTIQSVDSDTQIHTVGSAILTGTPAGHCLAWGDDDTTALSNAWTAAGCTASLQLPGGNTFLSANPFPAIAGCPVVTTASLAYPGQQIFGQGTAAGTLFIFLPNYNYTPAIGNAASNVSAFGNQNIAIIQNMNFWGLGHRSGTTMANTMLLQLGLGGRFINVNAVGWLPRGGGTSLVCIAMNGNTGIMTTGGSNFCGSIGFQVTGNGGYSSFTNNFFSGNGFAVNSVEVVDINGAPVFSTGNIINTGTRIRGTAVLNSINDLFNGQSGDSAVSVQGAAVLNLIANAQINPTQIAGIHGLTFASCTTCVVNIGPNHTIGGGSGAGIYAIDGVGTPTINFFGANNTFLAGGGGIWNGVGMINNEAANSFNVPVTAGKLVLSAGWGSTAAVTALTGGNAPIQFTITNSGTGQTNPATITYTFPTPYFVAPFSCSAVQIGGTNPTLTFIAGTPSATGVTFTTTGISPTVNDTEIIQVTCVTP
jgi:hypothetical protein